MLLVGELINSSRKEIARAISERDEEFIKELAKKQVESGADYIDVNCGTDVMNEDKTMEWLVKTILEVVDAPLSIDSPSEKALAAGLKAAETNGKQQMINSITAEEKRYNSIIPLVQQYKPKVVALCMDDRGLPKTKEERIKIADKLVADLTADRVPAGDIYLDPLVKPISTDSSAARDVLETIRYIRETYPKVHTICGISNVSFGLPKRRLINRAFLAQAMAAGMDGFILDPLDKDIMGIAYASRALQGHDNYCTGYLGAYRKGLFG